MLLSRRKNKPNKKRSHKEKKMEDPLASVALSSSKSTPARVVLFSSNQGTSRSTLADRLAQAEGRYQQRHGSSLSPTRLTSHAQECTGTVECVDEQGNIALLLPNGTLRLIRGDRIKLIQI
jgi:biotin-(acetyl-CoA carboxylase) ligase